MKTVNEVSRLTGVSIRTLHYYDAIGLLHPAEITDAGYRLYDEKALERLQSILFFRELQFPLKDIRGILDSPSFDRKRALTQQIKLLTMKKEQIERLIALARGINETGAENMDFNAFDTTKMDEYAAQAKAAWGNTPAYREYERKSGSRTKAAEAALGAQMMGLMSEFGRHREEQPGSAAVQEIVGRLQSFLTENYYTCTPEILKGLGQMYAGGGNMTENIDRAGGSGTGAFIKKAIDVFCGRQA